MEKRYLELRATEGRILEGTALPYGEIGNGPYGRERFEPMAFSPIGDVILNRQHSRASPLARTGGGGLEVKDTSEALTIRAVLPETQGRDRYP